MFANTKPEGAAPEVCPTPTGAPAPVPIPYPNVSPDPAPAPSPKVKAGGKTAGNESGALGEVVTFNTTGVGVPQVNVASPVVITQVKVIKI